MPKLKALYLVMSLGVVSLLVSTFLLPVFGGAEDNGGTQSESMLKIDSGWILRFDLTNRNQASENYIIDVAVDGERSILTVSVPGDEVFTYIKHINQEMVSLGLVDVALSKEGETAPFKHAVYYLR